MFLMLTEKKVQNNKKKKKKSWNLTFKNNLSVFTVMCDQFNACLLNTTFNLF